MEFFGGGGRGGRRGRGGDSSSSASATSTVGNVVRIIADTRTNSIVAVATEENMKTIETLVNQLDQGSAEMIRMKFFPLQYADAAEVASAIKEVFAEGDSSGSGQQSPWWMGRGRQQQKPEEPTASSREVKAVADVRTNAVIVAASERNFELIDDLVRSLDRQISDMLIVKVYELQNAEAAGMATILRDIFRPQVNATRTAGRPQQTGGGGGRAGRMMQMMGGNQQSASSSLSPNDEIEITSDERTNAVIVKASPEYIRIMDEVVSRLDQNPTESMSTYVLPLRFADAPGIAEVIRDLLQGSQGSSNRNRTQGSSTNRNTNSNNRNNNNRNRGGNLGPLEQEEDFQDPFEGEGARRGVEGQVDVQADEDTNSLVIRTSPRNFEAIQNIVNNLDKLRPQVLIKVLIADVTLDDTMKFGVEGSWENQMTVSGGDHATNRFGTDFSLATQGFTYTLTGDEFSGTLNMYAQEGRLKILATPRILVLDNQTAIINIGKQVPIVSNTTINSLGNTVNTVRYEDVGIILEVTPHINPDGLVTMEVKPEVSDIAPSTESVQITEGVTSPTFLVNSAETTVAVHNGQTVIIGGLIREVVDETTTKVPILGDIPLLGWLFRYKEKNVNRRELMIFITPYVAYTIAELEELSDLEKAKLKIIDQKDIESESDKWLERVRH
jgi:general secretion pathway protein D